MIDIVFIEVLVFLYLGQCKLKVFHNYDMSHY